MARFRKKPVVIEAVQWTGLSSEKELLELTDGEARKWQFTLSGSIVIPTLEGEMTAKIGDWIIKGVKGEFYPCKPDIFHATYELA